MRIAAIATCVLFPVVAWAGDDKTDKVKLQGTWSATAVMDKGKAEPAERVQKLKLIITDDKYIYQVDKISFSATFKLDMTRTPKAIDVTFEEGPKRGQTMKAIYSLEGDILKICGGTERPKEFKSSKDVPTVLLSFKRDKPPPGRWIVQESGIEDDLLAVAFVDDKLGWAVGKANTILVTIDGGKDWKRQVKRNPDGPEFHAVLFTSPKVGWVKTQAVNKILHTTDGGENWKEVPLPDGLVADAKSFTKHAAVGSVYFYQAGAKLFRTDDGKAWAEVTKDFPAEGKHVGGMSFVDLKTGMVAWDGGGFATTSDGGKTWKADKLKDKWAEGGFTLPQLVDAKTGWLLPEKGKLAATNDGGKTWQPQDVGESVAMLGLQFLDSKVGHVLVDRGEQGEVVRTIDGGKTWFSLGKLRNPGELGGFSFPSRERGWVVGGRGYIEHFIGAAE